jgi:hypothetical protein
MNDSDHEKLCQFQIEFAKLVRKFVPKYPVTAEEMHFLMALQDSTSCFNPLVWSKDLEGAKDGP